MRYSACGDSAFNIELGTRPSVLLTRAIAALHSALAHAAPTGFIESVPGLTSLTVLFDPDLTTQGDLQQHVERCMAVRTDVTNARQWHIPVCYAGEYAPDLPEVAAACGMRVEQVIEAHAARSYVVYLVGFSPGFPYLGDIDERLALPRRAEPRPRVPAGSVAIATEYTAIYPQATPGGWHIIGRTPVALFDVTWPRPALLAAGDTVRFFSVDRDRYEHVAAECAAGRYTPVR
jgi:inhibitor of KinA